MTDKREYERTHPWITFRFDTGKLDRMSWMRIGEAISKVDHIAGVPLAPAVADSLHKLYMAKGVHASTQIEGNTLTEEEVRRHLDGELDLPPSQEYLKIENSNVAEVCATIAREMREGEDMSLTPERIEWINGMVLKDLDVRDDVEPGRIRRHSGVVVGNVYRGAPGDDCGYLVAELCRHLRHFLDNVPENLHRPLKILRALYAHLYVAWIHPFGDGNGRTARLVEFQLLADAGFPTPACHLLSNYYNRTRVRYYEVLRQTSREAGYPIERFINYALDGLVEELREQLKKIREFQLDVAWVNFVHEAMSDKHSEANRRQRELVLSLPDEPSPVGMLRHLTPLLAEKYAGRHPRIMVRDINVLAELGLVRVIKSRGRPMVVKPNTEIMHAFLPDRLGP